METGSRNIHAYAAKIIVGISISLLMFLPLSSQASPLIYTIQAGSFSDAEDARVQFDLIKKTVNREDADYLRIEKVGQFYAVRIGMKENRAGAEKLFRAVKPHLSVAIIMKAYIKDERIQRIHRVAVPAVNTGIKKKMQTTPDQELMNPQVTGNAHNRKGPEASSTVPGNKEGVHKEDNRYLPLIASYEQAIRAKPGIAETHYNLGAVYSMSGRYDAAIGPYKKALQLKPDFVKAYYNLGIALSRTDRYEEAIGAYNRAVQLKPDYFEAYNNLGIVYGRAGRYQDAVTAYKRALALKPDDADALYNSGISYHQLGMYENAIEAYKKAVALRPDFAEAFYNLGAAYSRAGRHRDTIEAYKTAVKIKPDYLNARNNLSLAYAAVNDKDAALDEYRMLKILDAGKAQNLFDYLDR